MKPSNERFQETVMISGSPVYSIRRSTADGKSGAPRISNSESGIADRGSLLTSPPWAGMLKAETVYGNNYDFTGTGRLGR